MPRARMRHSASSPGPPARWASTWKAEKKSWELGRSGRLTTKEFEMPEHGKRYRDALKLYEPNKIYHLSEAVKILKKFPKTKFDETVELAVKLGVDPKQSDQMVRGTCSLPAGS